MLDDIQTLEEFSYAIQFSRTLSVITTDKKLDKYKVLSNSVENLVNTVIQQTYFELNAIGVKEEKPDLKELASLLETYLVKMLKVSKFSSIVIPSEPLKHYFVLSNVLNASNYIISQFIVCLHSEVDNRGVNHYVSFPTKMFQSADNHLITKRNLISTMTSCLSSDIINIIGIGSKQKRVISNINNVRSSYIADNQLYIELVPGIAPRDINDVLTKLLPQLYTVLNITDPRRDIIHRIDVAENGNKVIIVALMDRNFQDTKALRDLKRSLNLDAKTYKTLLTLMGV
jgi:hypothetical protein